MTTNYYIGLSRGNMELGGSGNVTVGTTSTTTLDVEIRMQIIRADASVSGLTKKDVNVLVSKLLAYLNSSGVNHAGADLPAL